MRESRVSRDTWALQLAHDTSKRSTCILRAVGCVLLDFHGCVMSTGYNGTPRGMPNCNDSIWDGFNEKSKKACPGNPALYPEDCRAVHAEANALLQCRDVNQIHTCYTTHRPCWHCTKLLLNTSCERVIFLNDHEDKNPELLWTSQGREWQQLKLTYLVN